MPFEPMNEILRGMVIDRTMKPHNIHQTTDGAEGTIVIGDTRYIITITEGVKPKIGCQLIKGDCVAWYGRKCHFGEVGDREVITLGETCPTRRSSGRICAELS